MRIITLFLFHCFPFFFLNLYSVLPTLPLPYLTKLLAFDTLSDAYHFISKCGGIFINDTELPLKKELMKFDCKVSEIKFIRQATAEEEEFASAGLNVLEHLRLATNKDEDNASGSILDHRRKRFRGNQ